MNGYTLDTNMVTAHLKKNPLVRGRMRQAERRGEKVKLNAVSYYETRRGLLFLDARSQLAAFERLWQAQGIVMINQQVLDRAAKIYADLRKAGQLIEQLGCKLESETAVTPLALSGKWANISLSAEEIDEARRECWAGLGN